jgi:predicted ATPase/DNA-binding SARP family transcriptional activator
MQDETRRQSLAVALLGPVEARDSSGMLSRPPGIRARRLIASLALSPGKPVPVDTLVDELWGDAPPRQPRAALQTLVSRVRAGLADGLLVSEPSGYFLAVDPHDIDLHRAKTALDEARQQLETGRFEAAATTAGCALALWQGRAGDDLEGSASADELAATADTLFDDLARVEAEAFIEAGRFARAEASLRRLADAHRFDDAVHLLLLRAQLGDGRPSDAAQTYTSFRLRIRDELGASPSRELSDFYARLLREDDELPSAPSAPASTGVAIGIRTSPNALLGRDADVAAVGDLLRSSRLVTVLGPGGLGKTRLVHEVAARTTRNTPAVVVVELASIRNGADILLALGSTLGIREVAAGSRLSDAPMRTDLRGRVIAALAERRTLLVVDNCEHLIDDIAAWVSDLLSSVGTLRVLATSRAPLTVAGEVVYQLGTLFASVGPGGELLGPAAELFALRARAARPGVTLPAATIIRLCTRLDGLPLAIELAAARVRSMTVEEIERRLSHRFALLTSGDRSAPERHRTLLAVIDWSWNLLDESQRAVLRRLSRFPDGFGAEAAQIVAADEQTNGGLSDITDDLEALVNQSLVSASDDPATGLVRYRMLETVREFSDMALVDAGEDQRARASMARWAREFSRQQLPELESPRQVEAFRRIDREQDTLIGILRQSIDERDGTTVFEVFAVLAYYWTARSAHSEVIAFGPSVIDATRGYLPDRADAEAAIASYSLIGVTLMMSDLRTAVKAVSRLRALTKRITPETPRLRLITRLILATSDPVAALEILDDARESADAQEACLAFTLSSQFAENKGDTEAAGRYALRAYELAQRTGDVWMRSLATTFLAQLSSQDGRPKEALDWTTRASADLRDLRADQDLRQLDWIIGINQVAVGEFESARAIFTGFIENSADSDAGTTPEAEAVDDIFESNRHYGSIAWAGLAEIARAEGDAVEAQRLYSQAAQHTRIGGPGSPWFLMLASAQLCAMILDGVGGARQAEAIARSLRARVLALHRVQPGFTDRPVTGSALLALAVWLLSRPELEDGAPLTSETGALALQLLALSERFGSRQDMASAKRAQHFEKAVRMFGADAVEATRRAVSPLLLDEAEALTYTLLQDPALRYPRQRYPG